MLHPKGLEEAIKDSVLKLSGDYGLACVQRFLTGTCTARAHLDVDARGVSPVKYLNAVTQVAIVRSPREHYRGVWAAISLMRSVGSRPFSPRVLHVGGTIRSCQKSLVAVDRERLKVALQSTKSTGVLACVFVCGGGGGR